MKSKKWGEKVNFLFLELIYFQESFDYMLYMNKKLITKKKGNFKKLYSNPFLILYFIVFTS